ncbi:uncharacterized protein [Scyliorhinus torazame]|uniref:uncharacterized protein isoform X2 n=1 Tax=Scyliorhinus torazame TaxID=75743 RepID=UPI003B5A04C3
MNYRFTCPVLLFALALLQPLGFRRHRTLGEADGRNEVFGAIGSSVLLDPERGADLSDNVEWVFTGSDGNPCTILDHASGYQREEPNENFKSRLRYFTSNGSLMLNNLKPNDQGVYTIIVNGHREWSTDLKLIEPLSEPLINITYVETTIKLTCQVSAGKASSIVWMKDGKIISITKRYQLVQNNSMFIISDPIKSDCGTYTCIVENPVSKKNISYPLAIYGKATSIVWMKDGKIISITGRYQLVQNNSTMIISDATKPDCGTYTCIVENPVSKKNISNPLAIYGLPQLYYYTVQFSIFALITAVAALICKIISFFKDCTSLQLLKNLFQILQFVIFIANSMYWIWIEGPHKYNVPFLVFFCLLVILSAPSICVDVCEANRLIKKLKAKPCCLKLMGAVTTSGSISVLCASIFLIVKLKDRADNECGPADNLQASLILAVVVSFISPLIMFTVYILCRKHSKGRTRARPPSPNVKGSHQPECIELVDHHLNSAALDGEQSCHESETNIPSEELV